MGNNSVYYRCKNLQDSSYNQLDDNLKMCVSFIRLYTYMHALIMLKETVYSFIAHFYYLLTQYFATTLLLGLD